MNACYTFLAMNSFVNPLYMYQCLVNDLGKKNLILVNDFEKV